MADDPKKPKSPWPTATPGKPGTPKPRTTPPPLTKAHLSQQAQPTSPPGKPRSKPPSKPPPLPAAAKPSAEELGIGDDWLNAVDEWDSKLDFPTSAAAKPTSKPPATRAKPDDPLMSLFAESGEIDLSSSEGEALGPGLGLEPGQAATKDELLGDEFAAPQPTVAVPQEKLLEKLLARPLAAHEDARDEFSSQSSTRAVSSEELERLIRDGADFGTEDPGGTTAVSNPDEDLLAESRQAPPATKVERSKPVRAVEPDYEVEIERGSSKPPATAPIRPTPASMPRVARPIAKTAPPRQPVAAGPAARPVEPKKPTPAVVPVPPPAAQLPDDFDLDVDLGDVKLPIVAAAAPITEAVPQVDEPSQLEDEPITAIRDHSGPIATARSAPVPLAPRAADKIDLGVEPQRTRAVYEPPELDLSVLQLPAEAEPPSPSAIEETARLLAAERDRAPQLIADEARLWERLGKTAQADALYAQAADAGVTTAVRALTRRALRHKGSEESLAWLARCEQTTTDAERPALELARAALLAGRRDADGARAALERAAKAGGDAATAAALGLVELSLANHRDADAIAALSRLSSSDRETLAALRLEQGRLAERLGKDDLAREAYQASWDAGCVGAGPGLSRVMVRGAEPALSAAAHAQEAKGAPSCATALARRAALDYRKAGAAAHALALLEDRGEPLALESAIDAAVAAGRPEEALKAAVRLAQVEADPGRKALAVLRVAEAREAAGDVDGAAAAYQQASDMAPSVPASRGIERTSAEHPDGLRRAAALAVAAASDPARAPLLHTRAARLQLELGNTDETRAALGRALEVAPAFGPALYELAALETFENHPAAIAQALTAAAAAESPDRAAVWLEAAGEAAARAGDDETCWRRYGEACALPDAPRPLRWALLGDDPDRLAAEAEVAEDAFAAALHHRRGWALAESDRQGAIDAFRAALAVEPLHAGAHGALAGILGHDARFGDWGELLRARAAAATPRPEAAALLGRAGAAFEYETRDYARALGAYADADALAPGFGGVREGLVRTALQSGDADRAAQLLALAAESAPSVPAKAALLAQSAAALERKGDLGPAAQRYGAALEVEPSPLVGHARTHALYRAGAFGPLAEAALAELKSATDPAAKIRAYDRLAELDARGRGDLPSAALAYESLLELAPDHHPSLRALERYFLGEDSRAELVPLYQRLAAALADPAASVAVWLERARLSPESALDDARNALERDRHAVPALLPLLAAAREQGDHERACELHLLLGEAYYEDGRAAAACLSRAAADLAALGRDAEALARLREACQLAPDHLPAQLTRLEVALRASEWGEACAAAEGLAACARRPEHVAEAALVGAVIAETHLNDLERALAGYRRVHQIDPSDPGAFARQRGILEQLGKHAELAALLDARMAHESEGFRVVELHLALADLYRGPLEDAQRARQHLGEATRLHPTNINALRALAELDWAAQDWNSAAETLIKVVRLEREPARLRDAFFNLGVLYADHLPEPKKAAGAFSRALQMAPTDREIVLRLSDLFVREKDWQNALTATTRLCELEKQPAARIEWLLRQAQILRDGYGDTRHAADALRKACDIDPRDLRPVEALAQLFQGDVQSKRIHLDRAMISMRTSLLRDAFDLETWQALARIFEWLESPDRAQAAAQVLQLFKGGGRAAGFSPLWDGLKEAQAQELIFPAAIPIGFRNLFGMVEDPLAKPLRLDPRRHGIEKRTRLAKNSPIAQAFATLGGKLGYAPELEIHVSESHPGACVVEPGETPLVVLGAALVRDAHDAQLRFLAGRCLYLLATHMAIPARMTGEELGLLVGGIVWQFVPDYVHPQLPQAALYESAQKMAKLLPRKQREPIMPYALECSGDLDFAALAQSAVGVGNRAGLLACGDLGVAIDMLCRMAAPAEKSPAPGEALLRACRGNAPVAHLLAFVSSEEFGQIRRLLS